MVVGFSKNPNIESRIVNDISKLALHFHFKSSKFNFYSSKGNEVFETLTKRQHYSASEGKP